MVLLLVLFWLFSGLFLYTYLGYPVLLASIGLIRENRNVKEPITPGLTLIISAYNEGEIIEKKIQNSLALDYPREKLEIVVVSDASSDKTEEIAKRYKEVGVLTRRVEGRVGKTACLNVVVPEVRGEIVVFSDANSMFPEQAVRKLVQNFADSMVGCVTGYTKYTSQKDGILDGSLSMYSQLERIIKEMESRIGSCVGADGAIFAIRKHLYEPLKGTDINDLVIPLNIVSKGYRTVIERESFCLEETAKDSKGEYDRQVRITNRTLRALFANKQLLDARQFGMFSFELFSHKIMKFLSPFFLIAILATNVILAWRRWHYVVLLLLQGLFYALAATKSSRLPATLAKLASVCRTFMVFNLSIAKGWIRISKVIILLS